MFRILAIVASILLLFFGPAQATTVYSPLDYGAQCNSNGTTGTDDSAAINAMFAAIRTAAKPFTVVSPGNRTCYISSSVNATGLSSEWVRGSTIELRLDCATSGMPCVDALSSRWINWNYLYINGEPSNSPNVGIQIGRISSSSADDHYFNRPSIKGYFTRAAFYNFAAETITVVEPMLANSYNSGGAYALVQDGYNHFNVTSAFVTETLPTDTTASFNENTFIGGQILTDAGNSEAIWLGGTWRHRFIGTYANSQTAECVTLYNIGAVQNTMLWLDLHCEGSNITRSLLIDGSQATPTLDELRFTDQAAHGNAIFAVSGTVTAVTLNDVYIHIGAFSGGSSASVFDTPPLYTLHGGRIYVPNASHWPGAPALFTGCLITPAMSGCAPTDVAMPGNMIMNGRFEIDQRSQGASITLAGRTADRWLSDSAGSPPIHVTAIRTTNSPPIGYKYSMQLSANTAISLSSTQRIGFRQGIEGSSFNGALWGTASAQPLTCGFWAKGNNIGQYPFAIVNGSSNRSYVTSWAINAANTWEHKSLTIPGDTTGTWGTGPTTIVGILEFSLGAGSTFQAPAENAWNAAAYWQSGSVLNFATITSATLNLSGVHCNFGLLDLGENPLPYESELQRAQRFYEVTFPAATAVGQNKGVAGSVTFQLPFAQATFGTASIWVPFKVRKFLNGGAPLTMTFYSPSASSANCYNVTQARDSGAAASLNAANGGFMLQCTLVAGDALGDQIEVQWQADSGF